MRTTRHLFSAQPVNVQHPLAYGLLAWYLCTSPHSGAGGRWSDLLSGQVGTTFGMGNPPSANSGWRTSTRAGISNELRFDSGNDSVTLPGLPGGWRTAVAWVMSRTAGDLEAQEVISTPTDVWNLRWSDLNNDGIGRPSFYYKNTVPTAFVAYDATVLPVGTMTCLVATYDGAAIHLYINGREGSGSPTTVTGTASATDQTIYLGRNASTGIYFLGGAIPEVRFYNYALPPSLIMALYVNSLEGYPGLLQMRQRSYLGIASAPSGQGPLVGRSRLLGRNLVSGGRTHS